jgi:hypothetical protein
MILNGMGKLAVNVLIVRPAGRIETAPGEKIMKHGAYNLIGHAQAIPVPLLLGMNVISLFIANSMKTV